MRSVLIRDLLNFERLSDHWNHLLKRSEVCNVFLTHEWLKIWWHYFSQRRKLLIVLVYDGDDLMGAAPLMITLEHGFRQLRFIGSRIADFEDVILTGSANKKEEVLKAIFHQLHQLRSEWDLFRLQGIKESSPTYQSFFALTNDDSKNGLEIKEHCDRNLYIDTSIGWESYRQALRKQFLYNTRRLLSRLEKEGKIDCIDYADRVEFHSFALDQHIQWHKSRRASLGTKSLFDKPLNCRFMREVVAEFSKKKWLDMSCIKVNDAISAVHIGFRYKDQFFAYLLSFDEQFKRSGIGRILIFNMIEQCCKSSIKRFDFMLGEEPYKFLFNPKAERLFFITFPAKTWRGTCANLILSRFLLSFKKLLNRKW